MTAMAAQIPAGAAARGGEALSTKWAGIKQVLSRVRW